MPAGRRLLHGIANHHAIAARGLMDDGADDGQSGSLDVVSQAVQL